MLELYYKLFGTMKKNCNFATEMVALPSKSGCVKEHQKGMR